MCRTQLETLKRSKEENKSLETEKKAQVINEILENMFTYRVLELFSVDF